MKSKKTRLLEKINFKEIFSIFGLFVIWRIVLQIIAFLGKNRFSFNPDPGYGTILPWEAPIPKFLQYWARWDSGFYLDIAEKGYFWDQAKNLFNTAFFPLYPFLIRKLALFFEGNNYYSGIFITTLASFLTCFFLYKIAKLDLDRRSALRSVFYFLIFPTAVFLAAIYTEALFAVLCLASFYYARKNKWGRASVFGFFTALTRPQGIILFPVLLLEYLEQRGFNFRKIRFNTFYILLIPLGLLSYMYYLNLKFKNPFLFISAQSSWERSINFSFLSIWNTFSKYFYEFFFPGEKNFAYYITRDLDLIFFLFFLILSFVIFFKFRMSYGFYIFLSLLLPLLTNTLLSIGRFVLVLFPVFIFLAKVAKKWPIANYGTIMIFTALFVLFTIMFVNWYWAG